MSWLPDNAADKAVLSGILCITEESVCLGRVRFMPTVAYGIAISNTCCF